MACITAQTVLLIGGANGGSLPRVLRLPHLLNVTLLDIDHELHQISQRFLGHMHGESLADPRVRMVFGPPHEQLKDLLKEGRRFDIIVADTPDATDDSYSSHLFSSEYLGMLSDLLTDDGIFVTQAGQAHPMNCRFTARVVTTLDNIFPETVLYTQHVQSFGVPWCFALAGRAAKEIALADPAWIDARLNRLKGSGAETYDGTTHRHMFSLPKLLRTSIELEKRYLTPITLSQMEHVLVTENHYSKET
ncbi:hypothetical protein [Agrobacterium vitis]|nr:hypothetical protein [Agrobacterium vitis]NSY22751.1 hypothetical protein [Agrobacterium vitis]NTA22456.1 hypothetical protein [Agrobacterium vitis]